MLRLLIITLVIVIALLRGGSLNNFKDLRLRWVPLAIGGFALQLLIFTPFLSTSLISVGTQALYVLSMALLATWVAANRHIPGMALMAAGLLMNLAAIVANDGHMPVSPASARYAGTFDQYSAQGVPIANNSIATDSQVRLWLLTDIIPLPKEVPFANVFSIGDIVLTVGAALLCYRTARGGAVPASAGDPPRPAYDRALPPDRSSDGPIEHARPLDDPPAGGARSAPQLPE